MHWFTDTGSRLLQSDSDANDCLPAKAAFIAAGAIWLFILVCLTVLSAIHHVRERDLQMTWKQRLRKSLFPSDSVWSVGNDISAEQTAVLDTRFNLQTLFFALVQVSFSMLILGGIQLNFRLTCTIVLAVVTVWTCLSGVCMPIWMSFVAEKEVHVAAQQHYTSDRSLRELKVEMHNNPLSFLFHFIEISFLKPMVSRSHISAGDIYQDIGRDGSRTFLLGVGQLILLGMYTLSIMDDGKPDLSDERLYVYYCLGIFIQVSYLSGQDVLYKSFYGHITFWGNVFCAARQGDAYAWEPPDYLLYNRPRMALSGSVRRNTSDAPTIRLHDTFMLRIRFFVSTAVNVGGLNIITLLLPLQLTTSDDPLSFVLSAVGAYYILGIDDYNEKVTYSLVTDPQLPAATEMAFMSHGNNNLESGAVSPDLYTQYAPY
jgi:hypothetical protein